mgnify:CR=1 FL=1
MKKTIRFFAFSALLLIFQLAEAQQVYYVDQVSGNDLNSGTSTAAPWKNLTKLYNLTLSPGSSILLKCGSVWNGEQLKFLGSGSSANPIIVDQYGTGVKPILNGNGLTTANQGVVYLYNQDYIEINNDIIINSCYIKQYDEIHDLYILKVSTSYETAFTMNGSFFVYSY